MAQRKKPGTKPHEPTEARKQTVMMHLSSGATCGTIAEVLGIDEKTLRKHYRRELDVGSAELNAKVTGKLFNRCMEGSDTALIWWDKTRNRMSERMVHANDPNAPFQPTVIELVAKVPTD